MEQAFIEIEFVNWEKYNPRNDVKQPSWFRFQNRLLESPEFFSWPGEQIKALVYIFSQSSQKNSAKIRLVFAHAERTCLINPADMKACVSKLLKLGVIISRRNVRVTRTERGRTDGDTSLPATLHYITGQDITLQDKTPPSETARTRSARGTASPLVEFLAIEDVIRDRGISEGVQRSWLAAFVDPEWIMTEVRKALAWETSNPQRKKKRFEPFMTRWLTTGWDKRSTKTSNNVTEANKSALAAFISKRGGLNDK